MEQRTCPSCGHDTCDQTRFPGSEWCTACVEATLEEQARESRDRVKPQVFKL